MASGLGERVKTWINIIGYECVWLIAVWTASHGLWWPAALAFVPFAAWVLTAYPGASTDLKLMAWVVPIGVAMDTLMAATGLLHYAAPVPSTQLAPLWIVAIWASFSLTLRHTFRFLFGRPWLAAIFGAIGAPLAYLSAERGWQAVQFGHGMWPALGVLALLWAFALPIMLTLAKRLENHSPNAIPAGEAHV
jgi:hypothetical protein